MIDEIIELWRQREDMHNAEKRLTLQIKSICRRYCGGDKIKAQTFYKIEAKDLVALAPLFAARDALKTQRDAYEKSLRQMAEDLPVWDAWGESVRGFGRLSLALIVGEAGDLSNYANPAKLWKRFGVAVMDGIRQGGLPKTATAQEWVAHGYSPRRRAKLFTVGDPLIKMGEHYRKVYLDRKKYEQGKAVDAGLIIVPAAKMKNMPAKQKEKFMSEWHVHRRSQRYMEKALLRDLWEEWQECASA